jgi:hypothetical protein
MNSQALTTRCPRDHQTRQVWWMSLDSAIAQRKVWCEEQEFLACLVEEREFFSDPEVIRQLKETWEADIITLNRKDLR